MVECTDKEYRSGFTDRRCIGTVECTDRKCILSGVRTRCTWLGIRTGGVRGWVYGQEVSEVGVQVG